MSTHVPPWAFMQALNVCSMCSESSSSISSVTGSTSVGSIRRPTGSTLGSDAWGVFAAQEHLIKWVVEALFRLLLIRKTWPFVDDKCVDCSLWWEDKDRMISLIRQNTFPIGGTTTLCSQLKCVVGTCLLVKPASPFSVRLLTTVTVLVTGDKTFAPVLSHLRTPKGVVTVIGLQKKDRSLSIF